MNRLDDALQSYAEVLARDLEHADANFNEALVRLCLGDFRGGWPKYEYRWKRERYAAARPVYPRPVWSGKEDVRGKTVLLCAEQGLGDAIQFSRYAAVLATLGAKVLIGAHRPLAEVLATVPGVAQVIPDGDDLPHFDLYCSLLSLPLAFGTEPATIPANIPYIQAQAERIAKWRDRVPASGRLRVGICWAGSNGHWNNRNRSMTLQRLAAIFSIPGIDFVCLQKEVDDIQSQVLHHFNVTQLGREFSDFADTAAVVAMLDIVISVDTSVAHLAGAMGRPRRCLYRLRQIGVGCSIAPTAHGIRPCGCIGSRNRRLGRPTGTCAPGTDRSGAPHGECPLNRGGGPAKGDCVLRGPTDGERPAVLRIWRRRPPACAINLRRSLAGKIAG